MHLRLSWLALPFMLAAAACSSEDKTPQRNTTAPQLDFSKFDRAVEEFIAADGGGRGGASVIIVHKDWGVVHTKDFGSFVPGDLYMIASSSKELSVGVLMRLADEGKLDLDAPIGNYLSAWGAPPTPPGTLVPKSQLTVAELLSNSSGLVSLTDNPLYGKYICQYAATGTLTDCAKTIYTADDSADRIPPDTAFHYGGGQWQLAGGIAEAISGKKWSELIKDMYGTSCGATSIGFGNPFFQAYTSVDGGSISAALAYPKFFQGNPANLQGADDPSIEGGAYTTVDDYGKVLLMHLRGGLCDGTRVLSDKAVSRMQQDRIASYGGQTIGGGGGLQGYGLGWWVDRDHAGVVADPGAYGAMPWLDGPRGYGAFIVLESGAADGMVLYTIVKPLADAVFDAAPKP